MLLWTEFKQKNLQVCTDHASSSYILEKRNIRKKEHSQCTFFHNHNYQGGTSKFIYKALILDNKQLLSNTIDHEATPVQVPVPVPELPSLQIAVCFTQTS